MDFLNIDKLYNELDNLTAGEDSQFKKNKYQLDDSIYVIFTYELPSYSDFLKPSALEARGIMFEVDEDEVPLRLASLTPRKFFNFKENPFTMNLDLSKIDLVMNKFDGSLMSTFLHNDSIYLKSKGSIFGDHFDTTNLLLKTEKFNKLRYFLEEMAKMDITINLEYISPTNKVVVLYEEDDFVILSGRDNLTGNNIPLEKIRNVLTVLGCLDKVVKNEIVKYLDDLNGFVDSIRGLKGDIEGFVIGLSDGTLFKMKTEGYSLLHKTKDSFIPSNKNIMELIIQEKIDDIKAIYHDKPILINKIEGLEDQYRVIKRNIENTAISYYSENKDLEKGDYVKKAIKEMPEHMFKIALFCYLQKTKSPDIKDYLLNNLSKFGINVDEKIEKIRKTRSEKIGFKNNF